LSDLIDYDDGVTMDQLFEFLRMAMTRRAEQSSIEIHQIAAGIAALFDPKILTDMTDKLKGLADKVAPETTAAKARNDMSDEEKARRSDRELSKLKMLFSNRWVDE